MFMLIDLLKYRMGKEAEEYERQRQLRIAENKARIDALGLLTISSGLMGSGGKTRTTTDDGHEDDGSGDSETETVINFNIIVF